MEFACQVCGQNYIRERLPGNFVQLRKLCDKCLEWHKWCSKGNHAPLMSQFSKNAGTKGFQFTCNPCLVDLRGSIRAYQCEHCSCEFVVWKAGSRFNGQGVILCDDCYASVKHCKRCDQFKPRNEFGIARDKAHGLAAHCMQCTREKWHTLPPARRASPKLAKYGLTYAEYTAMREDQSDLCAICGCPERYVSRGKVKPLAIDHCHSSGRVRALLCHSCNHALGHMADDPARLRSAADYLERWAT